MKQGKTVKAMATITNYGPEEYFVKAISVNFQARTGCFVEVTLQPDFMTDDDYGLTLKFPNGSFTTREISKEKLMENTTQTAEETLDELVNWFMSQKEESKGLKELPPKKEDSEIDVSEMML